MIPLVEALCQDRVILLALPALTVSTTTPLTIGLPCAGPDFSDTAWACTECWQTAWICAPEHFIDRSHAHSFICSYIQFSRCGEPHLACDGQGGGGGPYPETSKAMVGRNNVSWPDASSLGFCWAFRQSPVCWRVFRSSSFI